MMATSLARSFQSIVICVFLSILILSGCGGGDSGSSDRRLSVPPGTTPVPPQQGPYQSHDIHLTVRLRHTISNAPIAGAVVDIVCPASSNCLTIHTATDEQGEAAAHIVYYTDPGARAEFYVDVSATHSGSTVTTRIFVDNARPSVTLFWP